MSHVTDIDFSVTDLDCLAEAAAENGMEFRRDQKTYAWYGRWMNDWNEQNAAVTKGRDPKTFGHCDHAIRRQDHQSGDYEIGLVPSTTGKGYDLIYDRWGSGGQRIHDAAGDNLRKLEQSYSAAVARKQLRRQGFREIKRYVDEAGLLHIRMGR